MSPFTQLEALSAATGPFETSVVALISCFNRRSKTLRALDTLSRAVGPKTRVSVVLYDDGSSDGTGAAVKQALPNVTVVRGRGSLFWSASMAAAQ